MVQKCSRWMLFIFYNRGQHLPNRTIEPIWVRTIMHESNARASILRHQLRNASQFRTILYSSGLEDIWVWRRFLRHPCPSLKRFLSEVRVCERVCGCFKGTHKHINKKKERRRWDAWLTYSIEGLALLGFHKSGRDLNNEINFIVSSCVQLWKSPFDAMANNTWIVHEVHSAKTEKWLRAIASQWTLIYTLQSA